MKIAACLSGNGRTAAYCRPYIERFFRGHHVDWFIHAWSSDTSHLSLYDAVAVSLAELPDNSSSIERKIISHFKHYCSIRLIPMYWGIKQAIELVPHDKYDIVVRIRPDIVPHQRINSTLMGLEDDCVYFTYHMQSPRHEWVPPQPPPQVSPNSRAGLNDLLFFGRETVMREFTKVYDWLETFCSYPEATHFEASQVLTYFVDRHIPAARRAKIAHYLIDEENAQKPLALYDPRYRFQGKRAVNMASVALRFPDLAIYQQKDIVLTPEESWLVRCWSADSACPSPSISPSCRRILRKQREIAGNLLM